MASLINSSKPKIKSFLLNGNNRRSKGQLSEKFMFGRNRHSKSPIGKKFSKSSSSKGTGMKGSFGGSMKSSSISPSVDEFDSMMSSLKADGSTSFSKKRGSLFGKKKNI